MFMRYITVVLVLISVFRKVTDMLGFVLFSAISVSSRFIHLNIFHGYQIIIFFQVVRHLGQQQLYAGL